MPTTWDETRLIDGYPGRYVVLARRKGATWYVAAINAEEAVYTLDVKAVEERLGGSARILCTGSDGLQTLSAAPKKPLRLPKDDGAVLILCRGFAGQAGK